MSHRTKVALLVEDEPMIAMMASDILTDMGYTVFEADTRDDALSLLAVEQGFTLLFTDIDLADGSSGVDVAVVFARMNPGMPIVATSGHNRPAGLPDGVKFVPKPYTHGDLENALPRQRNALKRPPSRELSLS